MSQSRKSHYEELLLSGQYERLVNEIDATESDIQETQRIMLHFKAMALVYLGDLEGAKQNLILAEKHYGEHIGILRDLAFVYYQTGELIQWRKHVVELEARLKKVNAALGVETKIQTQIALGKFHEEQGVVHLAAAIYDDCYTTATTEAEDNLITLALIQKLRVKALYRGLSAEVSSTYRELLAQDPNEMSFDLRIELEHSMMLAELELVGPRHAWERVQKILADDKVCLADRRLFVGDFVAESLVRKQKLNSATQDKAHQLLRDGDQFEQEITELMLRGQVDSNRAHELSWANYLRLLTIQIQIEEVEEVRVELRNKLNLLLADLNPNSRYLWLKRIEPIRNETQPEMDIYSLKRAIKFQGKLVDLSKKRTLFSLFTLMAENSKMNVDNLIQKLWNSDYSPEHHHRLRMTIHRTNQILFELCAIPKAIEMTHDQVNLNSDLKVRVLN